MSQPSDLPTAFADIGAMLAEAAQQPIIILLALLCVFVAGLSLGVRAARRDACDTWQGPLQSPRSIAERRRRAEPSPPQPNPRVRAAGSSKPVLKPSYSSSAAQQPPP